MKIEELNVQDMSCGACVKHVTKALLSVAGVAQVDVDLANGLARVKCDLRAGAEPLISDLASEGYPAKLVSGDGSAGSPKAGGCDSGTGAKNGCSLVEAVKKLF